MNTVGSILSNHMWAIIGTFITQYVWSAFVSALPAPTATSSTGYQFWFKFLNILAANLARAQNTAVERSPNFQDAVNKLPGPVNKPVVVVEPPAAGDK